MDLIVPYAGLASQIPNYRGNLRKLKHIYMILFTLKSDVLYGDLFYVEADCRDGGKRLGQVWETQPIQDGRLTGSIKSDNQDTVLPLAPNPACKPRQHSTYPIYTYVSDTNSKL